MVGADAHSLIGVSLFCPFAFYVLAWLPNVSYADVLVNVGNAEDAPYEQRGFVIQKPI